MLKKLVKKYRVRFELPDDEELRSTYAGELNYECGKAFIIVFIIAFSWATYIPGDLAMHPERVLVFLIRFLITLVSISAILLRFTKCFHSRPDVLMMVVTVVLHFGFAVIAATAGEAVPNYVGGFTFIIMAFIMAPFTIRFKTLLTALSFVVFILIGIFTGMDFSNTFVRFGATDLFTFICIYIILSYTYNTIKYRTWEQRQKLKSVIAENERNLITISNLAKKAEASDRAKSEFLAAMSHEIRTPMNAVIGIAQIELQKSGIPDEYAGPFAKIYDSGNILLRIINDILDMSKIETGKMELVNAEYDVARFIDDTAKLNMVRIGSKPIDLMLSVDEELPSKLLGDELRLKQILNNLLSNAIKYTDEGFVKLHVSHREEKEDVFLYLMVEDTGQGITEEDQGRLFSEFTRFNNKANYAKEGAGLGLVIAKKLAEMMGGTIEVESEYGIGSVFTVAVKQKSVGGGPIGREVSGRLSNFTYNNNARIEEIKINAAPMPNGRVLVVDDMTTNLYVACGLLKPYELFVDTAKSGGEAIEIIENGGVYDVIFMDHMMPGLDGLETAKILRERGYRGTIVALTANAILGNEEMFLRNGFDAFISKPIDVRQLDSVLVKYIRDKGANDI